MRLEPPIGINVAGQIAGITNLRGWLLISLVAIAAYVLMGGVAVCAWILGAVAGLSASTPWDVDTDDEPRIEPTDPGRMSGAEGSSIIDWWKRRRPPDARARFHDFCSAADCCRSDHFRPAYS